MRYILLTLSIVLCGQTFAQYGGSYTYAYLQLPPSARISGLGGLNVSTPGEGDVTLGYMNPALLNAKNVSPSPIGRGGQGGEGKPCARRVL